MAEKESHPNCNKIRLQKTAVKEEKKYTAIFRVKF